MARPRAEIDEKQFTKLCEMMCTEEEIAEFFDVSIDTLNRWCKRTYENTFAGVYKTKKANGKTTLRRYQMQLAEKYPAMAIFLGKQYLGQTEKPEDFGDKKIEVNMTVQDLTGGQKLED